MGTGHVLFLVSAALGLGYLAYRVGLTAGRGERRRGQTGSDSAAQPLELAAQIAHAIHTPLCALVGTAQMSLEAEGGRRPELDRIVRLGRRVSETVDRMLDLGHSRPLALERASAAELLRGVELELSDACKASGVELALRVDPELPPFLADPVLLLTALVGIVENAVEAQPDGGDVVVHAQPSRADRVRLTVSDTGPGMSPELRARVLEPFVSSKCGGAGLGLAIASRIARDHGGSLAIDAEPGGGARVSLELPLRPAR